MHRTPFTLAAVAAAALMVAGTLVTSPPAAALSGGSYQSTELVSVGSDGKQIDSYVENELFVDGTGRYVFFSTETSFSPDDADGKHDVYRRDRLGGTTKLMSIEGLDGDQITDATRICGLSRNGAQMGLIITASTGVSQLWVKNLINGSIGLASLSTTNQPATSAGMTSAIWPDDRCAISNDGRYVAFESTATNLVPGNTDNGKDVYRRDRQANTIELISQSSGSVKGDGASYDVAMSASGAVVAFSSIAKNLVVGDTNNVNDIFVRDPSISTTTRVSVKPPSTQLDDGSSGPSLSADGNLVAFATYASNAVANDTNGERDVFVRNRTTGTLTHASRTTAGAQISGLSVDPVVSDDGRYVAFQSNGDNLPGNSLDDDSHMYRRDLLAGTTALADIRPSGVATSDSSYGRSMSADGRVVAFIAEEDDLVRSDKNKIRDAYVHDFAAEYSPFGNLDSFIQQQYIDFTGDYGTLPELSEWKQRLVHGESSVDHLINVLAHDPAFAAKRGPLVRLYWAYFLRPPDTGGLNYWTKKLTTGSTLAWVSQQFAKSSEFQTKYGSLSNSAFVTLIYQNIFQRDPDAGGLAYWTGKLDKKQKTRGDVMVNFSESSEGKRFLAPQVDTILIWFGMLRTAPSKATVTGYIEAIRDGGEPPELVAHNIRAMQAYADRV